MYRSPYAFALFRILLISTFIASAIFLTGCPMSSPIMELQAARQSIEFARQVKADQYAKPEFESAEQMFAKATDEDKKANFEEAKAYALSSKSMADIAKDKALAHKEATKVEDVKISDPVKIPVKIVDPKAATVEDLSVTKARKMHASLIDEHGEVNERYRETLEKDDDKLILKRIYFDYDSSSVREDQKANLAKNAAWLTDHPEIKVQVEGHTDIKGSGEYNLALGERRAKAVMDFLIAYGISATRVSIISYGKELPLIDAQTEEAYTRNRRAEFVIVP